ncbi:Anaerobic selenocysteine-containing dehydrogenase [Prauserella marina]|uniref:Anaerobic selenocysteine-containing dehydrogenase n=1 Tax=Prauserella marina TaxID=530584 RepID=A0A1G6TNB3_9PSEU|nr:molybdopterin-dependent oxidoreductase [Prauserella marina]PWV75614.1 anaerobic selenocysteine-containing dehydrogenase [Prauserella marina]SDD30550.1 Anaerobic selenocysteine-containing dehydrogenase [Prauserella marina]
MAKLNFADGSDVRRTFCTLCPQHCGMLFHVDGEGHPQAFDGDRENPVANGKLCIKGTTAIEIHQHDDRLNFPLKRVGKRGEGKWERISWEQAMDEIAEKLRELREKDGPESVATLGGTHKTPGDWASWRWAADFGTPNFVSQGRNCGVSEYIAEISVYGWDTVYQSYYPGKTKCIVIWGSNPAESSPPSFERLRQCQAAGAKLIVVDPRRTKTAQRADLHLPVRPRTDGALALGMIHVMIRDGIYDKEFVEQWCTGFDEVEAEAAKWTPERTEEITGVPADDVVTAAHMYATLGPARLSFGVAATQLGEGASRSAVLGRSILRAISGNLDRPGGEPLGNPYDPDTFSWLPNINFEKLVDHPLRTRESVNAHENPITSITGYQAFRDATAKVYPQGHTGTAYVLFASQPAIYRAVTRQDPYPVKAILVQCGEPLLSMGAGRDAYEAFTSDNLELLVTMDMWMTPTAQLSDYVLPAADFMERADLSAHWGIGNFFVVGQQVSTPLGERRNDYDLWAELGRRLSDDPGYWPETVEGMFDRFLEPSGKSYREWADGEVNHRFIKPVFYKYRERGFATPSGKVELVPSLFERFGIEARPVYTGPPYSIPDAPEEEYPLQMIPGSRVRELTASNLRQSARLRRIHPEPLCDVHPDTAAKYGVADGEWMIIERPEGAIRQRARFDESLRRDTVNPDGYWWNPDERQYEPHLSGVWVSNANAITPGAPELSSFAGDQPLRGARCRIRAGDAPEAPARDAPVSVPV